MNDVLQKKLHQGVFTLTLNKPEKHNAFDDQFIQQLTQALKEIHQDKNIHVVILNAAGKNFCSGADLGWMQRMTKFSEQENQQDALNLAHLLQTFSQLNKPVIALVQGYVLGGGLGLLACSDIVIAASNAQFCFPEVKLGLIPATIAPYVTRKIGYSASNRYFLSAEMFDAEQALQLGLIHKIVELSTLSEAGDELTELLLKNGAQAMSAVKTQLNELYPIDDNTIKNSAHWLVKTRMSIDAQRRLERFFSEKK